MLHTLAQQLEAQKARADTAAARCSALSKEMAVSYTHLTLPTKA